MRKNLHSKLVLLLAAVLMGVGSAWAADETLTIGFEDATYTDWALTNIKAQQTNTGVNAHGGSYYGGTDSKESGSVVTKEKIASPQDITFYVSKESTNTNASSVWQIKVSSDGTTWTKVGDDQNAAVDITKGEWTEVTRNLSSYTDVYVGVFYSGTTAKRCIDDITITYTSEASDSRTAIAELTAITPTEVKVNDEGTFSLTATFPTGLVAGEDYEISWNSDNDDVLDVDSSTGEYQAYAKGTANITVSVTALDDATYKDVSKVFTVTVTEDVPATVYEKVTSATQLVAGNEYILVATDNDVAMGAQGNNIRSYVDVNIDNDKVAITNEAVAVLTLGGSTDAWTFLASDNDLYLAYSGTSNQVHSTNDAAADASKWKITSDFQLESANVAGRVLKYNSGSPRFACYANGQKTAVLFVKSGSSTDSRTQPELSWSAEEVSIDMGATDYELPYLVNRNQLEVTVTSSNEEVAYYTANGIMVNTDAAGTATLTATFEGDNNYLPATATCTITVVDNRTVAEIAWDPSEIEIEVGAQDYTQPRFVNTNQVEVTFTSTDEQNASYTPNGLMVNTSVAGTYTITATFAGNSQYLPTTAELTITVVAPDEVIDEPVAGQGCFVKVTSTDDITAGNYLIVYEDGNVAFNGSLGSTDKPLDDANNTINVTIVGNKIAATDQTVASIFTIQRSGKVQSKSGYYIGQTSDSNGLKADGKTAYVNTISIDDNNNNADIISANAHLRFNSSANNNRFRYFRSSTYTNQQAIQLYKYDETVEFSAPITVTDAGWATYIAEGNVEFPAAVSAYIATSFNEATSSVTLKKVKAVNQGTPVIVKAEAGTYPLENAVIVNNVEDNLLVVYRASKGLDYGYNPFVLAKNASDGSACFKQWVGNKTDIDGRVVLPLKLDLNSPNAVRALTIVFSDTTTGIETVGNAISTMDNGAYTLSGQRVQKPTKGLYIIGGKKVVVK